MSFEETDGEMSAETFTVERQSREDSLGDCVRDALDSYFTRLDGHGTSNLYQLVMEEVERPLFKTVMEHTRGNQTRAAAVLGISRSTLRKKLAFYKLG
ncbi:DNA-binding transcriptional regulator Fis [Thiolapillus sp.]